jgi:tetratricopeptide (TPR) repeat protein
MKRKKKFRNRNLKILILLLIISIIGIIFIIKENTKYNFKPKVNTNYFNRELFKVNDSLNNIGKLNKKLNNENPVSNNFNDIITSKKKVKLSSSEKNETVNDTFKNNENEKPVITSVPVVGMVSAVNIEEARKLDEEVSKVPENFEKSNYTNSSSSYSTEVLMNVSDSDIGLRLNKALKLMKLGHTITAMEQMRKISRENKKYIAVWHNLALGYLMQHDKNNAIKCINKLEKLVNSNRNRKKLDNILELAKDNKLAEALVKLRELKPSED